MTKEQALDLLRRALANPAAEFREGQWEAVSALIQRRNRLLVVERTGWGKSLVYFLATRILRDQGAGCTLLISPLLALMRNQIAAAQNLGVRAATINSSNTSDWAAVQAALLRNEIDVLLISPERLANDDFVAGCLLPIAGNIGLFVVDEAHCISDWGHDFRPNFRRIVRVLAALPSNIPVLATTATANDRVVQDIVEQLGPRLEVQRGPLTRASLRLQNIHLPSKPERMAWLSSTGIRAEAYNGQMETEQRQVLEDRLLANDVKVLVATVALGMGFDKPDLGFVIHFQRPGSVVHYYQQVGRAGRAVDTAYGILLRGQEDDAIAEYFIRTAFPTPDDVQSLLNAIESAPTPLSLPALEQRVNLPRGRINTILLFLSLESPSPIQKSGNRYVRNPVAWQMPVERIQRITDLRRQEQQQMEAYIGSRDCLMQFLGEALNDPAPAPCGKCINCTGALLPETWPANLAAAAVDFLNRVDNVIQPRHRWPAGLPGPETSGAISPDTNFQEGRSLCLWGDPGLGALVRQGKQQDGAFDDRLVAASADLVESRWKPQPRPEWVTCVPSARHPALVPDFARRLAYRLGLPFIDSIRKIQDSAPQKRQSNSFQQARNVIDAFDVPPDSVLSGPVLLVDDMVDSRWTFTVLAALLRRNGSGPVFVFALADSSSGDD